MQRIAYKYPTRSGRGDTNRKGKDKQWAPAVTEEHSVIECVMRLFLLLRVLITTCHGQGIQLRV